MTRNRDQNRTYYGAAAAMAAISLLLVPAVSAQISIQHPSYVEVGRDSEVTAEAEATDGDEALFAYRIEAENRIDPGEAITVPAPPIHPGNISRPDPNDPTNATKRVSENVPNASELREGIPAPPAPPEVDPEDPGATSYPILQESTVGHSQSARAGATIPCGGIAVEQEAETEATHTDIDAGPWISLDPHDHAKAVDQTPLEYFQSIYRGPGFVLSIGSSSISVDEQGTVQNIVPWQGPTSPCIEENRERLPGAPGWLPGPSEDEE